MYDVFYLQVPGFRMIAFFYIQNKFLLRLKPLDVEFMKALHNKVNIVPVISKADTLTLSEVRNLKKRILSEIAEHGIKIYHLPDADDDEDEEFKEQTRNLKVRSLRIKLSVYPDVGFHSEFLVNCLNSKILYFGHVELLRLQV